MSENLVYESEFTKISRKPDRLTARVCRRTHVLAYFFALFCSACVIVFLGETFAVWQRYALAFLAALPGIVIALYFRKNPRERYVIEFVAGEERLAVVENGEVTVSREWLPEFGMECVHQIDHSTHIRFTDGSAKKWRLKTPLPPKDYEDFVRAVNHFIDAKRAEIMAEKRRALRNR